MKIDANGVKVGILAGILAMTVPLTMQAQSVGFEMRAGLVISSGYKDTLDEVYPDYSVSGGYGWLDLGFGIRIPVADGLSIVPGADLLMNFVSGSDDEGVNTIILPSVNLKYVFGSESGFYVQGGLNYAIINMGTDRFKEGDLESDGVGFQATVGYQTVSSLFVEGGYVQIPVTTGFSSDWSEDFGGLTIRGGFGF